MCNEGLITGAMRFAHSWAIPFDAKNWEIQEVYIIGQIIYDNEYCIFSNKYVEGMKYYG